MESRCRLQSASGARVVVGDSGGGTAASEGSGSGGERTAVSVGASRTTRATHVDGRECRSRVER